MNLISSTQRLAGTISLKSCGTLALIALLSTGCQSGNKLSSNELSGDSLNSSASQQPGTLQPAATDAIAPAADIQPVMAQPVAATATPSQSPAPVSNNSAAQTSAASDPAPAPAEPSAPVAQLSPNDPNNEWFYEDRRGPESGTIRALEQREEGCVLSLKVPAGQTYKLYGTDQVCADATLSEQVTLTYDRVTTPTCSDVTDDCARLAVTQIQTVGSTTAPASPSPTASAASPASYPSRNGEAVYTEYRNEKRSILVTSAEPWSGENDTGNFTFQRCDVNKEQCDEVVTGGKAECNESVCLIVWDGIAQHSIKESRFDSEAIANYLFIWNYHHAAINEPMERYGETFF